MKRESTEGVKLLFDYTVECVCVPPNMPSPQRREPCNSNLTGLAFLSFFKFLASVCVCERERHAIKINQSF